MSTVNYNNSYRVTGGLQRFDCLAWVNFNGTGTVAIRASGNVSSITDNGTGDYTVNFTSALPDANYAVAALADIRVGTDSRGTFTRRTDTVQTTSSVRLMSLVGAASTDSIYDPTTASVVIFR